MKRKKPVNPKLPPRVLKSQFNEIIDMIHASRQSALAQVNTTLLDLYWNLGKYIHQRMKVSEWGDAIIEKLALHIQKSFPNLRGFTRANLFRMRQFYQTYCHSKKIAPLVRQLPWTHHLIILGRCRSDEEREFYIRTAISERWPKRQLERQFKNCLYERVVLSPAKVAPLVRQTHPKAEEAFRDSYMVEFLDLPTAHTEADLHRGLIGKLRDFLIELGRDFCFVGSEYPLQVGHKDFYLDLLFFHRGLNCLVAIELLCGAPHNNSSVVFMVMWRSVSKQRFINHISLLNTT